jgi:hypothetical protein
MQLAKQRVSSVRRLRINTTRKVQDKDINESSG